MKDSGLTSALLAVLMLGGAACSSDDSGGAVGGSTDGVAGATSGTAGQGGSGGSSAGATGSGGTGMAGSGGAGAGASSAGSAGAGGSGAGAGTGEPPELVGITRAHNDARATEGVAPLTWDPALAAVAEAWAAQCMDDEAPQGLIDHNSGRSDNYPGYVGENIYGSSGVASVLDVVTSWMSEKPDYDYATGTCSGICGHYTQVMWAASSKLGCARANCPAMSFGNAIICNYSPGGNNGGKPF